jgi:predicted nucleic acid-binding protein
LIVVDTTILVYAAGVDHPLRSPSRALFDLVATGHVRATTTVEAIQEFAHARARRRPRTDAAALARAYAIGLGPLTRPDDADVIDGLELFESTPALDAFDAVMAAAARRRGWAVASADRAFSLVPGLTHLHPGSPSFVEAAVAAG